MDARIAAQRLIEQTPIFTIPRITNAPSIIASQNPTAKWMLKQTPRVHRWTTRNNTPSGVPLIARRPARIHPEPRRSTRLRQVTALHTSNTVTPPCPYHPIPRGATSRIVTQQALNVMTLKERVTDQGMFTPRALKRVGITTGPVKFEHYASPMVHPITGETIFSYKKLMNDPTTAEVW